MFARGMARARVGRPVVVTASVVALSMGLAACSGAADENNAAPSGGSATQAAAAATSTPVEIDANIRPNSSGVAVDTRLRLTATGGSIKKVTAVGKGEETVKLPGTIVDDGAAWRATELLEPDSTYWVTTIAVNNEGERDKQRRRFTTEDLSLDQQTYPSIAPLDGETVGVGMPVVVKFDVPVEDRASIEKHLKVSASTPITGSWHWFSDTVVHFRPKNYWKPGTEVTVKADINGVWAGNGVYGQLDREISFDIGQSVVSKVNIDKHRMKVFINGSLARTIPVTTGKKGFETRSGTKVVMEKHRTKRMDAATTGISEDDPEYYNIEDVPYALRVTYSGEFVHGAPWSAGSQGAANVSHGCVGMSVKDARWLYERTHRGDIVKVTGSDRTLEKGNGWTDWDMSFAEYRTGSALP